MTSLTDLAADVYTLTNRPDLVGETVLAIKAATIKAHRSDYWYKDIQEIGVKFDAARTQQTLDYKGLVPRWRSLKYLREYDYSSTPGTPGAFLTVITPDEVLDSYSVNKENVCYMAGVELQIRTRCAFQYFLLGCYVYPDVTDYGFSSWIADECRYLIIYDAAATVFKTIGYDEQASVYRQMVVDEYNALRVSNILANGY